MRISSAGFVIDDKRSILKLQKADAIIILYRNRDKIVLSSCWSSLKSDDCGFCGAGGSRVDFGLYGRVTGWVLIPVHRSSRNRVTWLSKYVRLDCIPQNFSKGVRKDPFSVCPLGAIFSNSRSLSQCHVALNTRGKSRLIDAKMMIVESHKRVVTWLNFYCEHDFGIGSKLRQATPTLSHVAT